MRAALKTCENEGIEPIRANVLEIINDSGMLVKEVTPSMLTNWTKSKSKWSPIRCDKETNHLYDTHSDKDIPLDWDGSELKS